MMWRHGDVQIVERTSTEIPKGYVQIPAGPRGVVLAEGEVTGHAHLVASSGAHLYRRQADEVALLFLEMPAEVWHNEHVSIKLPAGMYEIGIKRQYDEDSDGWTNVAD